MSATTSHAIDARRMGSHRRVTSICRNNTTKRMMLTESFKARNRMASSGWRLRSSGDIQVRIASLYYGFMGKSLSPRILMIAPEPFFEPRGTPFSEFHRIRALTTLGHEVDLVTYPFGQSVTMTGLRIFRSARPPFVRRVKIGPSFAKIPLDALLTLTALRRAWPALRRDSLA